MKRCFLAFLLVLAVMFSGVTVFSAGSPPASGKGEEKIKIVSGKLTGYGKDFVEVHGEKIRLCWDATIMDPEENAITVTGLCATESVQTTVQGSCASKVQILMLRR
jgi:hypothetical protein